MKPYLIWTPNYSHYSGGIETLHLLCHHLNRLGQEAYVNCDKRNPDWNTPFILDSKRKKEECIVVYPEIVTDNPLEAKDIVRYVLNRPGLLGGNTTYNKNEKVFTYFKNFYPQADEDHTIYMPFIDRKIFKDKKGKREGGCYYLGKSRNAVAPENMVGLDLIKGLSKEELADLFNRKEVFYTCDSMTALSLEANMCGCYTVIIPDGQYTREQVSDTPFGMLGQAWGLLPEEIERAKKTGYKVGEIYDGLESDLDKKLNKFIELTQEKNV